MPPTDPFAGFGKPGDAPPPSPAPAPAAPPPAAPPAEDWRGITDLTHMDTLPKGDMGAAFGEAARGATLGFGNDVAGMTGPAIGAVTGHPGTSQQYRDAEQHRHDDFSRRHPVASGALQIGGSLLNPVGWEMDAYLAARGVAPAIRAMIVGGSLGGADAAGQTQGDLQHRLAAIPGGVGMGAAGGALLHGAAKVAGPLAARAGGALSEAGSRIRAGMGHEPGAPPTPAMRLRAQQQGTEAVRAMARRSDPTGQKLRFNPREARGKPITAAEALGRGPETQLKVAGRRQGQTPDALEAQLRARREETADRVVQDFAHVTGIDPEAAEGDFVGQMAHLRAQAAPLYERAYAHTEVESPELTALLERPAMKRATANAMRIAQEEGRDPTELGFVMQKVPVTSSLEMSGGGKHSFVVEQEVEVQRPTMQTWDYIKRGMDDVIEGYRKNGKLELNTQGRAEVQTLHQLRDALTDPAKPWGSDYGAALNAGGEPLRQEEAFRSATKLLSGTVSVADFGNRIAKYTPAQVDALKAGIVNQVRNAAMAGRQRLGEMVTPAFKAKMERVFGKKAAAEIAERIEDERFLMQHGNRMMPGVGSDTSETLLADQEQREALKEVAGVARHATKGEWGKMLMHALSSPLVGAYRGAQMPMDEATRDVIGALLAKSPSEFARVLQDHGATAGQASHVAGLMQKAGMFAEGASRQILGAAIGIGADKLSAPKTPDAVAPTDAKPDQAVDPKDPFGSFEAEGAPAKTEISTAGDDNAPDAEPAAFTPNAEMAGYLEHHLGVPIRITSSFRSEHHNAEVGGVEGSAHTKGEAWDFVPEGMSMDEAGQQLANSGILFDQIEITPTHVHVSFDPRNRGQVVYGGGMRAQSPGGGGRYQGDGSDVDVDALEQQILAQMQGDGGGAT